jgi:hypothetical protein
VLQVLSKLALIIKLLLGSSLMMLSIYNVGRSYKKATFMVLELKIQFEWRRCTVASPELCEFNQTVAVLLNMANDGLSD